MGVQRAIKEAQLIFVGTKKKFALSNIPNVNEAIDYTHRATKASLVVDEEVYASFSIQKYHSVSIHVTPNSDQLITSYAGKVT